MPLNAGDPAATSGLARDIYEVLDAQLRPPLEAALEHPAEQLPAIQDAWRKLSFCIASGVVDHLVRVPPTDPEFAQTFTSSTQDAAYWSWLSGFAGVFRTWAAGAGSITDLRNGLNTFFSAHPTPTELMGVVQ
jgi:hypothetical protein